MFHKQGTPQPFEILKMSMGICEICKEKQAVALVNGKKVCESCKEQANSTEK